jgi:hypothetical protein
MIFPSPFIVASAGITTGTNAGVAVGLVASRRANSRRHQ